MASDIMATIRMELGATFADMLALMDDVDALCDAVPEWYPGRDELIARVQKHALRLCREATKGSTQWPR